MAVKTTSSSIDLAWRDSAGSLQDRIAPQIELIDNSFEQYWQQVKELTATEARLHDDDTTTAWLWQAISAPLRQLINSGGKRFRALLYSYQRQAENGNIDINNALLIEVTHAATLIADDIEDNSLLRRGQPSIHCSHGLDFALNSCNWGYFLAPLLLRQQSSLITDYLQMIRQIHLGQALDIYWHQQSSSWPDCQQYLKMCRLKTGALLGFCCQLALKTLAVNASKFEKLQNLWQQVGQTFQMLDDLTNITVGNAGKVSGDDLLEGKKSWPLICYIESFPASQRQQQQLQLSQMMTAVKSGSPDAAGQIYRQLSNANVIGRCYQQLRKILQQQWHTLQTIYPDQSADGLFDLLLICYNSLMKIGDELSPEQR